MPSLIDPFIDPLLQGMASDPAVIPFSNLVAEWHALQSDTLQRIQRVFEHGQFVMGPEVAQLEQQLAQDVGVRHAITCSSGTTALQIALMALDLAPGDEVILPAFTFAAPLEMVLLLGLKPMLADIDPRTFTIDIDSVEWLISPRTRAIIAVSLYGNPADFARLNALASRHGIPVIEDAAQSYGATLNGRRSGSLSTLGCTSFFPTKPLGGCGDGGALFTNDAALAGRISQIRDHGQCGKYKHVRLGINGRLDSIACAALMARVGGVEKMVAQRQQVAQRYDTLLAALARSGQILLPMVPTGARCAFAQYSVQLEARDAVADAMRAGHVQAAVHYPTPLHQQPAFQDRVSFGTLTHAETVARRVLCLPIYPALTPAQQERVADVLTAALLVPALSTSAQPRIGGKQP